MYLAVENRTALKTFKKILRVLLWVLVGILGLVVLLCVAVYLPPVQKFAIEKASVLVTEKTGMHLSVERFRLRFPIGISVYGVTVVMPSGDTLAGVGSVRADAALWPLLAGRVLVRNVSVENAHSLYRDTTGTLSVDARLDAFSAGSVSLGISDNALTVYRASLDGADVSLFLGARITPEKDTIPTVPWRFEVRRIDLSNVKYAMEVAPTDSARLAGSSVSRLDAAIVSGTVRGASVDLTEPLTVKTDRVEIADSFFAYSSQGGTSSAAPFDPRNIRVDSLGLAIGDFSYRYTETSTGDISARLDGLHFTERSGLQVASAGGDFTMGEEGFSLKDFALATAASNLELTASVGEGIVRVEHATLVSLTVSGEVGARDILFFAPLDPAIRRALGGETVTISAEIGGTLGDISIAHLAADMPGRVKLTTHGKLHGVTDPKNISGNAAFDGTLERLDFVKGFIADTALRRRIAFPPRMTLKGEGKFSPEEYELSNFVLAADTGRLDVKGRFAMRSKTYDATVRLDGFPIGRFLPRDSLGAATLSLAAHGQGFDPFTGGGMNAEVEAAIEHLDYKRFTYSGMALKASLADGKIDGRLTSSNEAIRLDLALDGTLERDKYSAGIKGKVEYADLEKMGFSGGGEEALAFGTNLDIRAGYEPRAPSYILNAAVDSTALRLGNALVVVDTSTTVRASASPQGISAAVLSGDLTVDLSSPLSLDSLIRGVGLVGGEVKRQLAARHFSADSLQSAFPSVTLSMRAGRVNILRELARLEGLDFRSVSADISTAAGRPFAIDATVRGFRTGELSLDTIGVHAHRNGARLDYALRMAGSPTGAASLGLIEVTGSAGGKTASVNIYQRNRADSVGFRFGLDASLDGKTLRAEMTPHNPILGYQKWTVNPGNSVEYDTNGRFRADLRLTGPVKGEYVNLTSASLPDIPGGGGALRLAMNAVAIGPMLDLMPTPPPIDGILSSDLTFGIHGATEEETGIVAAKGTVGVGGFSYNRRRVADVAAEVDFHAGATGTMALDASVMLENKTAVKASGTYMKEAMDFAVNIPGIPLAVAEAFIPADMAAKLSGSLDGNFRITGQPSALAITGDAGFTDGRADVGIFGTAFGISPDRITVEGGRIAFNGFGLTAPNKQKLSIDGGVDFSDLARPRADVKLSARNFRFVDSQHIGGSQIYGTAALNAGITAKGPFSAMVVRGDISLSDKTDIVYILRNQSKVKDMKQHIVEFTVFADSLYTDEPDPADVSDGGFAGVDMLVGVRIGEGLKATLSLDELNENRVELIGGGDLAFSMNTQGDMRLAGRYSLTGGTVYYRPPVIAQKVFAVKDGSYVEWTGEAAKPQFHVTATQKMEVSINHEGGMTEQVAFDISIDVSGSLSGIEMRFNVAAPGNLMIQNQLIAMSDEARMQQALTLLIYEQYTGPGVSTKRGPVIDANTVLNDFIAKEVNQWARNNLKGVDLSMGIDTRNEDPANVHTNYKYSVSKSMFSDRVKISIGGSVADNATSQNFAENLVDDVSLEYRLTRRDNMFLKVYRLNTRESILEGEVVETGAGFVLRKKINKLGDLFRRTRPKKLRVKSDE